MIKLSACVIAKNEAANIARCLGSVKDCIDEIIVVDTGSTDDTVSIAEKLGAKVFRFEWINDFAAARNYALDQAKGNWIVFLDADEYIVAGKGPNLRPLLEKVHGNRQIEAITCMMEHTEGMDGPLKARDRTVRVFRNSPAIRYKGRIHEAIFKHDRYTQSAHAADSALVIRHSGYNKEILAEKVARNHVLLEESVRDGSANGMTYYYLAHSCWALRLHERAVEYARKAIEDGMVFSSMFAHRVYVVLIESMLHLATYGQSDVEPVVAEAMDKYSHHPEVIKSRGLYLRKFGYYNEALRSLLHAIEANKRYDDVNLANEFLIRLSAVHRNIADLYDLMNNPVKALEHSVLAVKNSRYDAEAFEGLISLLRGQKAADIVWLLSSLYNLQAEADVEFLVNKLAAAREKKVFAYYEKIWAERFGHQEFTAMKFLLSGHPTQALPLFAAAYRETGDKAAEVMIAVAILLGGQPSAMEAGDIKLDPSYLRVINAFFQPAAGNALQSEDLPRYLELVKNFLHIGDEGQLSRMLEAGLGFPADEGPAELAAILAKEKLYLLALKMYTRQSERPGLAPAELGKLCCQAGFCCYKLKGYKEAADLFAQALAAGYRENDLGEYMSWLHRQCTVETVREKIGALQARYGFCQDGSVLSNYV